MIPIARSSRAVRPWLAVPQLAVPLLAAVLWLLGAAPARAASLDFDALLDLTDAAAANDPNASLTSAQVLSEASVQALLGYDAAGTWATSGAQGILNSLGPVITFTFPAPVLSFAIDVLGIEKDGSTLPIALLGLDEVGAVIAISTSDPLVIGDSGLHEQTLTVQGSFASVRLTALVECGTKLCSSDEGSTFFADSARFRLVPEPGTLALVAAGLAALAGRSRR